MLSRREPTVRFAHWNHGLNGFAFNARLGTDETCVVGRRYNKSLDRSAFSGLFIRKTRMPVSLSPRPVNSTIMLLLALDLWLWHWNYSETLLKSLACSSSPLRRSS